MIFERGVLGLRLPLISSGLADLLLLLLLLLLAMVFGAFERLPLHQLFVVTLVGILSGVYIYRPLLEEYSNKRKEAQQLDEKEKSENERKET